MISVGSMPIYPMLHKTNQPSSYSDSSSAVNDGSNSGKYLQGFGLSKISSLTERLRFLDLGTLFI